MPAADMTLALAQTCSAPGDVAANVAAAIPLVQQAGAAGARLLAFPELSLIGYHLDLLAHERSWVTQSDPRLRPLAAAAARSGVTAVVGAAVQLEPGVRRLASMVFRPDGTILVHGKHHLHGAEHDHFDPAPCAEPLQMHGWTVALAICFDAAFPTHAATAREAGADLYLGSALYTTGEERRLDLHYGARAMDNRMYAAVANHTGGTAIGASGVWSPTGERIAHAGGEPELLLTRLRADEVNRRR